MTKYVTLLIIGAGPYGLAMAAYARHRNIDYLIVGKPMDFWESNMPKGLLLRSPYDWHIDPLGVHTIETYLKSRNLNKDEVEPIPVEFYLSNGNILKELETKNGYPVLDEYFQSNIPGLFLASFPATQDFGPFFGFVIGEPAAARIIGSYIENQIENE